MNNKKKLNSERNSHDQYLENLVSKLDLIGEDRKKIKWVMKDGIWQKEDSLNAEKLCDIIISYYGDFCVPIELKGSFSKARRAKDQIKSGKKFIESVLNLRADYGKVVVYSSHGYFYRSYIFDECSWDKNWSFTPFE